MPNGFRADQEVWNYYLCGAKPIPKTVWLACLGWETVSDLLAA